MKKLGKFKRFAASALIAGIAAGVPVAGIMPSSVMAAETGDVIIALKQSAGGVITSSATDNVKLGEEISLNAVADEGYRFAYWNLRNDGYHEILSGSENESSIKVKIHDSYAGLFTAEAVFIKDNVHSIRVFGVPDWSINYAQAGDVIDFGRPFRTYSERKYDDGVGYRTDGFIISRVSDDEDITFDVVDFENNTFVMPDDDIIIASFATSSFIPDRILDEVESEQTVFSIEDDTNGIAQLPDSAEAGEEIEIITVQPEFDKEVYESLTVSATYRIERVSDGEDMTDDLMLDDSYSRFVMPYYDIKITVDKIASASTPAKKLLETDDAESVDDDTEGELSEDSYEEKVLDAVIPGEDASDEGTAQDEPVVTETTGEIEAAQTTGEIETAQTTGEIETVQTTGDPVIKATENITDDAVVKAPVATKIKSEDSVAVVENDMVKPAAFNEVKTASAVSPVQSVSAPATRSVAVYTPSVVRSEGSSTVTSTPATGDYGITAAVTVAAIAAGAGIVAAAVMLKRRMTD